MFLVLRREVHAFSHRSSQSASGSASLRERDSFVAPGRQKSKTYSSGYSHVVTHRSTSPPVDSLSTGERTGSSVLYRLWPYVLEAWYYLCYKAKKAYSIRSQGWVCHSRCCVVSYHRDSISRKRCHIAILDPDVRRSLMEQVTKSLCEKKRCGLGLHKVNTERRVRGRANGATGVA